MELYIISRRVGTELDRPIVKLTKKEAIDYIKTTYESKLSEVIKEQEDSDIDNHIYLEEDMDTVAGFWINLGSEWIEEIVTKAIV